MVLRNRMPATMARWTLGSPRMLATKRRETALEARRWMRMQTRTGTQGRTWDRTQTAFSPAELIGTAAKGYARVPTPVLPGFVFSAAIPAKRAGLVAAESV